ncbi:Uncharacterised protein [Vibrio cholerae]|nr:Uncharacterised protein [Vibrio cholerae]
MLALPEITTSCCSSISNDNETSASRLTPATDSSKRLNKLTWMMPSKSNLF